MKINLKKMRDYKYIFIDFNDSFSMNIVETLFKLGITCEVINIEKLKLTDSYQNNTIFILGPGPGHPDEYDSIYSLLDRYFGNTDFFFVGVCLGHQILLHYLGYQIKRRLVPRHGERRKITLPEWKELEHFHLVNGNEEVFVQEYNSLVVYSRDIPFNIDECLFIDQGEVLMAKSSNFISYQFHPESIGTTRGADFFRFLKDDLSWKK